MPQYWKNSLCEPADVPEAAPGKEFRRSSSTGCDLFSTIHVDKSVRIPSGSALSEALASRNRSMLNLIAFISLLFHKLIEAALGVLISEWPGARRGSFRALST
jgi:hypothetical protein